jgi:hypothetical protein
VNGWMIGMTVFAMAMAGLVLVALAVGKLEPHRVYILHGSSWGRPRRVGINVAKDFDRQCWRTCRNPSCRSRLCKYKHGADESSQSWVWGPEIDWAAEPKRWPALRRRNRMLVFPVLLPSKRVARWVEDALLAHYQCPYNTQGVRAKNRAPKRERPREMDRWAS